MKKNMRSRMLLIVISLTIIMLLTPTAVATIFVNEDFESDTTGANPSSTWYTYSEDGDFSTANVSEGSAYSGSKSFYINDSANDVTSWANFSFKTVTYYDYFYFRFQIGSANWHNSTNVTYVDSSGQILGYAYIMNTTLYFNNSASNIMSVTIQNGTSWYRVYVDFNLTTDRIGCYVYNESDSSALLGYGWGDMEDGAGTYSDVQHVRFSAASSTKTSIYIDDLRRSYTYANPAQASIDAVVGAISALFAVAILLQVVAMFAGEINPYSLIMVLVTIIIGVITLIIIAGL